MSSSPAVILIESRGAVHRSRPFRYGGDRSRGLEGRRGPRSMNSVRILDLDGSLVPQRELLATGASDWIPAREWGPGIRLACTFRAYRRFRDALRNSPLFNGPAIPLYGSGDFHHVTLALLDRISGPFNLLVLDKHPDWMRGIPFLHCGTWLRHALRLPNLNRVFHCGGETDFENAYQVLAPWGELRTRRVVVFPAGRVFRSGGWEDVPVFPLGRDPDAIREALQEVLSPYHEELTRHPLYVSIDKDVLTEAEAAVNWDSGLMTLPEAVAVL